MSLEVTSGGGLGGSVSYSASSLATFALRGFDQMRDWSEIELIPRGDLGDSWVFELIDSLISVSGAPENWKNYFVKCGVPDNILVSGRLVGELLTMELGKVDQSDFFMQPMQWRTSGFLRRIKRFSEQLACDESRGDSAFPNFDSESEDEVGLNQVADALVGNSRDACFSRWMEVNEEKWGEPPVTHVLNRLFQMNPRILENESAVVSLAKGLILVLGDVISVSCRIPNPSAGERDMDIFASWSKLDLFLESLIPLISLVALSARENNGFLILSKARLHQIEASRTPQSTISTYNSISPSPIGMVHKPSTSTGIHFSTSLEVSSSEWSEGRSAKWTELIRKRHRIKSRVVKRSQPGLLRRRRKGGRTVSRASSTSTLPVGISSVSPIFTSFSTLESFIQVCESEVEERGVEIRPNHSFTQVRQIERDSEDLHNKSVAFCSEGQSSESNMDVDEVVEIRPPQLVSTMPSVQVRLTRCDELLETASDALIERGGDISEEAQDLDLGSQIESDSEESEEESVEFSDEPFSESSGERGGSEMSMVVNFSVRGSEQSLDLVLDPREVEQNEKKLSDLVAIVTSRLTLEDLAHCRELVKNPRTNRVDHAYNENLLINMQQDMSNFITNSNIPRLQHRWTKVTILVLELLLEKQEFSTFELFSPLKLGCDRIIMAVKYLFLALSEGLDFSRMSEN